MRPLPSSRNLPHQCPHSSHPCSPYPPPLRSPARRWDTGCSRRSSKATGAHRAPDACPPLSPQSSAPVGGAGPSSSSLQTSPPIEHDRAAWASAVVRALPACLMLTTLVSARAARAEERPWKPRRHHRRLEERFKDTWAEELVQEQEAELEQSILTKRRQKQLRKEQEQREAAQRKAEEAARRQRAEQLLAKEATAARKRSELPFSMKVGGMELAPFVVWGGVGVLAFGAFKGMVAANNARLGRGYGSGRWVYDRSLGGKMVWVPDYVPSSAPGGVRMSDMELNRVASIAAAAATASTEEAQPKEFVLPEWWNPGPRFVADPSIQASRASAAERLLSRIESSKVRGSDYDLQDVVRLRTLCQEGCVTLKVSTVGSRDAIYRTAVEAAIAVALDPVESKVDIGGVAPTRFVCALAYDLGVPEERAVTIIVAATAATTRARLLDALTGIKEDEVEVGGVGGNHQGETFAVLSLIRLSSLLEKMPVLQAGGKEVSLIAESLQGTFLEGPRRKAFHLLGQLYPEAAALGAQLLGFDPGLVVPQLLADVDRCHRRAEEEAAAAAAAERQQQQQQELVQPQPGNQ